MIQDSTLTRTEKLRIAKLLEENDFNAKEFALEIDTVGSDDDELFRQIQTSVFRHVPSICFIKFGVKWDSFSPGCRMRVEQEAHYNQGDQRQAIVENWLAYLKAELEAPDLWAELANDATFREGIADTDNTPIDAHTKASLLLKLEALEQQMATHLEDAEKDREDAERDREFVRSEFEYLKNAIDRLGKKDWLNMATGVLVKVGTSLAMDQVNKAGLVHTIKEGLIHLFNNFPQLPPGAS